MSDTAKKLVDSALLIATARLMSAFGVPLGLAVVGWLISGQIAQDKSAALHALRLESLERANIRQDETLGEIKRQREADISAARDLQTVMARAVEKLDAQGRSLQRIESYLDAQRTPRP